MKKNLKKQEQIIAHLKTTLCCTTTGKKFSLTGERVRQIAQENNINIIELRKTNFLEKYNLVKDKLGLGEELTVDDAAYLAKNFNIQYKDVIAENITRAALELNKLGIGRVKAAHQLNLHYRTVSKYLDLKKVEPGCYRGEALKKRDAEMYLVWKKENKKDPKHAMGIVSKLYNISSTNVLYCLRRHLYGDAKSKLPLK